MLVRKLRRGDEIRIGEGIILRVRWLTGDNLTLAIEAPRGVSIHHEKAVEKPSAADDFTGDT